MEMMDRYSNMYGTVGPVWEYLIQQAKDSVESEGHVVLGIFPCGNCLFDLSTEKPEILCFYGEHVDCLIDPTDNSIVPMVENLSAGSIHYRTPYGIVKTLNEIKSPFGNDTLSLIAPYVSTALENEEDIFLDFENTYANFVKKHFFTIDRSWMVTNSDVKSMLDIGIQYLKMRTSLIFQRTKIFVTNHRGYDISAILGKDLGKQDLLVVESIYENKYDRSKIINMYSFIRSKLTSRMNNNSSKYLDDLKHLGKIVRNFYRISL